MSIAEAKHQDPNGLPDGGVRGIASPSKNIALMTIDPSIHQ